MIVTLSDDSLSEVVRGVFDHNGAESVDRARKMWWIGLRDVEKERYQAAGRSFDEDEDYVRAGFEAALLPSNRDKSYDEARESLRSRYPQMDDREPFEHGYERGQAYCRVVSKPKCRGKA